LDNLQPQKPKKPIKWIILILAFVLLFGAGIGVILYWAPWKSQGNEGTKNSPSGEKQTTGNKQGYLYKLDPFIVNLADPGALRFLKVKLDIESNDEKVKEEYEKRLPQLRDAVLMILSKKQYADINSSEGKEKLREEIKVSLNQLLETFKIKTIYFTEFVIQ
jgi:flagellar protein FliL